MNVQKAKVFLFMVLCLLALPGMLIAGHDDEYHIDYDHDGYPSLADGGDDCDDFNAAIHPNAIEICDVRDVDEDCDVETIGLVDPDGDGFNSDDCANIYPDGTENRGLDCDDTRTNVNPMAPDFCDGVDNNCDGAVDDSGGIAQFLDNDLDGFGDPSLPSAIHGICPGTVGWSPVDGDCDDGNPAIQAGSMICDANAQLANAILVCTGAGSWQLAACAEGSMCLAQVNGTGVCVPDDPKAKKK